MAYMKTSNKRSVRLGATILGLGVLLAGNLALASSTAGVAATVSLQTISVSVTDGSVSYGNLAPNATHTTLSGGLNDQQTASNNGNVTEQFAIEGSVSTPDGWTMKTTSGAPGANEYKQSICTASCGTEGSPTIGTGGDPSTGFIAFGSGAFTTFATAIAASSGTKTFDLMIQAPASSTSTATQTVSMTVQAAIYP